MSEDLRQALTAGVEHAPDPGAERIARWQAEVPKLAAAIRHPAPAPWAVAPVTAFLRARGVQLTKGVAVLSVTRFPLLRAYRPALWEHVLPELDRAAAAIAAQQNGTVRDPRTVTIAGRRARRYDVAYERSGQRLVERFSCPL